MFPNFLYLFTSIQYHYVIIRKIILTKIRTFFRDSKISWKIWRIFVKKKDEMLSPFSFEHLNSLV